MTEPEEVTTGELSRRLTVLEVDVREIRNGVAGIREALAGQSVKVGTVWAGLGIGSAGFVTALVDLVIRR